MREWAAANGIEVNDRGRIPANIREQFDAAQK
ncbi:Lsr2 family DNA-binding protein [Litorihabitans aurantiacus]